MHISTNGAVCEQCSIQVRLGALSPHTPKNLTPSGYLTPSGISQPFCISFIDKNEPLLSTFCCSPTSKHQHTHILYTFSSLGRLPVGLGS